MKSAYEAAVADILARSPVYLDNVLAIQAYVGSLESPVLAEPVVAEAVVEPAVAAPEEPVQPA